MVNRVKSLVIVLKGLSYFHCAQSRARTLHASDVISTSIRLSARAHPAPYAASFVTLSPPPARSLGHALSACADVGPVRSPIDPPSSKRIAAVQAGQPVQNTLLMRSSEAQTSRPGPSNAVQYEMSTPPRSEKLKPPQEMSLLEKIQSDRTLRDQYNRIAASPKLSPAAAIAARQIARSYAAAVTLGEKALEYERQINDPQSQAESMRALGIIPLLDGSR